jgi:hypothetical protein
MGLFGKTEHHNETIVVNKESAGAAVAKGLFGVVGQSVGSTKDLLELQQNGEAEKRKEKAEKAAEVEAKIAEIANIKFEGSAEEIADTLNALVSNYQSLPTGFDAGPAKSKQRKAAIREKMEFGILKLRKLDAETADFFRKKLDGLK